MTLRIVTDSTCDLPREVIEELEISVVPCYINFPDRSYLDGVDITRQEFYERLPNYPVPPTTSAPAIGTFAKVYRELLDNGASAILSIHISSALSGIYNVAYLASEAMENLMVKTFDSGQLTLGIGLLVEAAAKAAKEGKPLEEVLQLLKSLASRTYTYAMIDTLKYLRRSGRVSRLQANLGMLLQVKPILHMNAGNYGIDPIRTAKRSFERMVSVLQSLGKLDTLSIVHTHAPEKAEEFAHMIRAFFPNWERRYSVDVSPVIGSHIGPGAVGFSAIASQT